MNNFVNATRGEILWVDFTLGDAFYYGSRFYERQTDKTDTEERIVEYKATLGQPKMQKTKFI